MILREAAPAKLNVALHVRRRRTDGYHDIETIFAFAELGDTLSAKPSEGGALSLEISGPFAKELQGNDNLVLDTAHRLRRTSLVAKGATLKLDKQLPVAAGLGGGSADAAAALRLLDRLWRLGRTQEELLAIAQELGADVPACLVSRPVVGGGRGDRLEPMPETSALWSAPFLILANPRVPVSTPLVFAAWDGRDRGPLDPLGDPSAWRNDLQATAIRCQPVIAEVLALLAAAPASVTVRMSGSGATCFASFAQEKDRDRALAEIKAAQPNWWLMATRFALEN